MNGCALAEAQLAQLPPPIERNWLAFASLAAGYDDNVALVSGADVLDVSGIDDAFAELQLAVAAPLSGAWRFDAGLVLLDYQDLNDFDQVSANAGAHYRLPFGTWNGDVALQLAYATLAGEGFQSQQMLALQASKPLAHDWRLRARYRFSELDGLDGFSGLDGQRHELDVRAASQVGSWDVTVVYRFDMSDYDDETLSLDRHQLAVEMQRALNESWTLQVELARDHSRYDADGGSENRTELELAIIRTLSSRWRVVMRYGYADNDAGRAEFAYQRNRISAGIEATL